MIRTKTKGKYGFVQWPLETCCPKGEHLLKKKNSTEIVWLSSERLAAGQLNFETALSEAKRNLQDISAWTVLLEGTMVVSKFQLSMLPIATE